MKNKNLLLFVLCLLFASIALAQNVAINTTGNIADSSAMLDVQSTTSGFLMPRVTTLQRNAIMNPAEGLQIYNLTTHCVDYYDGSVWVDCSLIEKKQQNISYGRPHGANGGKIPVKNIYTDRFAFIMQITAPTKTIFLQLENTNQQQRTITSDVAGVITATSAVLIDSSLYVLINNTTPFPQSFKLVKYNAYNIAAGGVLMTFSGLQLDSINKTMIVTSDGTDLFFNYNAGHSMGSNQIAHYTISGNSVIYQGTVTCGVIANACEKFVVYTNGDIFGNVTNFVYKFNSVGTLQYTITDLEAADDLWNWDDTFYFSQPGVLTVYTRFEHQ